MVLMGIAEKSPGLLEGINKPGIHISSNLLSNIEINGQPLSGNYYRVSPAVYPETNDLVEKISQARTEQRLLQAATPADNSAIEAKAAEIAGLNEQLQKAKTQTFNVRATVNGIAAETPVELAKWDLAFLAVEDGKIEVGSEAPDSQSRAVMAFLALCATLAYFAMRKPIKNGN
jgi:hypothetical protein